MSTKRKLPIPDSSPHSNLEIFWQESVRRYEEYVEDRRQLRLRATGLIFAVLGLEVATLSNLEKFSKSNFSLILAALIISGTAVLVSCYFEIEKPISLDDGDFDISPLEDKLVGDEDITEEDIRSITRGMLSAGGAYRDDSTGKHAKYSYMMWVSLLLVPAVVIFFLLNK